MLAVLDAANNRAGRGPRPRPGQAAVALLGDAELGSVPLGHHPDHHRLAFDGRDLLALGVSTDDRPGAVVDEGLVYDPVSEILTEQTLGRGLRLPFGACTGWELLDTLEVLAHERYEDLLKKARGAHGGDHVDVLDVPALL